MTLSIDPVDILVIRSLQKEIVLGIIRTDGQAMLRVTDAHEFRDHQEWVAKGGLMDVLRGFSILVKQGEVTDFFPRSCLNPGADARLEEQYVTELLALLPTAADVRILE